MRFDLEVLEAPPPDGEGAAGGTPLQIPIDAIDEDPTQPRREFSAAALQELATTIAERGIRQPISVRPHATHPGRWILNFGARRLRAAALAGKKTVPAFVDLAVDGYDKIIENEQREALRPLELAFFVERELALGTSQAEIARRLGKSEAYITYVAALIDAPDWLLALYRAGRCTGLKELYDLRRLDAACPEVVGRWLEVHPSSVARRDVDVLKDIVEQRLASTSAPKASPAGKGACLCAAKKSSRSVPFGSRRGLSAPPAVARLELLAAHAELAVRVLLDEPVAEAGVVCVEAVATRRRLLAPIATLQDLRLVERVPTQPASAS